MCDRAGFDILHVKGLALDPSLRFPGRDANDVDVLCRPRHVRPLLEALHAHGWRRVTGFAASSSFAHALTLRHPWWGYLDLHRLVPGIGLDPDLAFEALWAGRETVDLAGVSCPVPDRATQALVLLLHAARSHGSPRARRDVRQAWDEAPPAQRAAIRDRADRLQAGIALAAVIGELESFRDHPEHDLWAVLSQGGSRLQEWRARLRAARGLVAKTLVVLASTRVDPDHLGVVLGRRPTAGDLAVEFVARPVRGLSEELRRCRGVRASVSGRTRTR